MASGCGAANIATHFVLAYSGYATPFVLTCCCCVLGTLLRGLGSHHLLFLEEGCDTLLENADACGWDWLLCRGTLWSARITF